MVAQQELIMICADNSFRPQHFSSQLDVIHMYCHVKLKSNPKTAVGIFTMARGGPRPFGCLLHPTSDLDEIMSRAQGISRGGDLAFTRGIMHSTLFMKSDQPSVQKRLLIFARGPTDMWFHMANLCGNILKEAGIAVDLVNFYLEKEHRLKRLALNTFFKAVKNDGNSHIKHLVDGYSIRDLISSTPPIITPEEIAAAADLKMPPRHPMTIKVKTAIDPELFFEELRKRKKSQADADDEFVKAQGSKDGVNKFAVLLKTIAV